MTYGHNMTIENLRRNAVRLPANCLGWEWERLCSEINDTLGQWADHRGLVDRTYQGGIHEFWSEARGEWYDVPVALIEASEPE